MAPCSGQAGDYLDNEDPPLHGDALYVLGGAGSQGHAGRPGDGRGQGPEAWFTGERQHHPVGEGNRRECRAESRGAVAAGLDPAKAHRWSVGTSTMEEAVAGWTMPPGFGHDIDPGALHPFPSEAGGACLPGHWHARRDHGGALRHPASIREGPMVGRPRRAC